MPTYSPNKGYPQPIVAGDSNQWGALVDQAIGTIDLNLGGLATIPVATNPYSVTASQAQNLILRLTGSQTGNFTVQLPPAGGFWIVDNQTFGGYSATVITSATGSTGITVPNGAALLVYSDGTNVFPANGTRAGGSTGTGLALSGALTGTSATFSGAVNAASASFSKVTGEGTVPIGAGMDWWTNTPPAGWIFAYGQAISRTTYAALFALWGTAYGAGDGTTTFNVIDCRGRVSVPADNMGGTSANRVTAAGSGIDARFISQTGGDQLMQTHGHLVTDNGHTHGVTDPGHTHSLNPGSTVTLGTSSSGGNNFTINSSASGYSTGFYSGNPGGTLTVNQTGLLVNSAKTGLVLALAGAGGSQNMPPAIVCNYIIYTGV